jgi:hypothetical protein
LSCLIASHLLRSGNRGLVGLYHVNASVDVIDISLPFVCKTLEIARAFLAVLFKYQTSCCKAPSGCNELNRVQMTDTVTESVTSLAVQYCSSHEDWLARDGEVAASLQDQHSVLGMIGLVRPG